MDFNIIFQANAKPTVNFMAFFYYDTDENKYVPLSTTMVEMCIWQLNHFFVI